MNPLMPFLLNKIADDEELSRFGKLKKKLKKKWSDIGTSGIRRRELRAIKKQIKAGKPTSEKEKAVERLAGKGWTKGKFLRGAAIGGSIGALGQAVGSVVEGTTKKGLRPRSLARGAVVGAMMGAASPAAARLADIEAAKRGVY